MSQEVIHRPGDGLDSIRAPEEMRADLPPAAAHSERRAAAALRPGDRFSDEDLHAMFGVPTLGGIRVGRDSRHIVLVRLVGSDFDDRDIDGLTYSYVGQNHRGNDKVDQVLDGNNLALSRSQEDGYTVLYFVKQDGVLVFNDRVECVSHELEDDPRGAGGRGRKVIVFKLRAVRGSESSLQPTTTGAPGAAADRTAPRGDVGLDAIEMVEDAIATHVRCESRDHLLSKLPRRVGHEDLDRILNYLARSGKIEIDGNAVRWRLGPDGSYVSGLGFSGCLREGDTAACTPPLDGCDAETLDMVENLLAKELVVDSAEALAGLLPRPVDAGSITSALSSLARSNKIMFDGEAILWVYRKPGEFEEIYRDFMPP